MYISAFLSCSRVKASVYNAFPPRVNSKPSSTVMWKVWVVKISSWIYLTVQPSLFLCLLTEMDNYVTTSSCLQFSLPYSILQRVVNLNLWLSNFTFLIGLFNVVPVQVQSHKHHWNFSLFLQHLTPCGICLFLYLLWQYSWSSANRMIYFINFPSVRPKNHLQVIQMMYKDEFLFVC